MVAKLPDELRGERLRLNRRVLEEVDALVEAIEDSFDELHQWMSWADTMPTRDELRTVITESSIRFDTNEDWAYSIYELATSELVGGAGLHPRGGPDEIEIGYWIRTDRTGRGYATEVSSVLTTAAFEAPMALSFVKISMNAANTSSAAVPRKLGFRKEHEMERSATTPAQARHGEMWVISRTEWEGRTTV